MKEKLKMETKRNWGIRVYSCNIFWRSKKWDAAWSRDLYIQKWKKDSG